MRSRWYQRSNGFWRHWRQEAGSYDADERCRMWRERLQEYLGQAPEEHWFFGNRRFMAWCGSPGRSNPLVGLMLSRGGGLLPLFVLHLLSQGPRYGNDIMREIEQQSKGAWVSNPGAIYPLLRLLERRGLLKGQWEDDTKRTRRIYHLTDWGRQELARLKELMRPGLYEALEVMKMLFDTLYAGTEDVQGDNGDTKGGETSGESDR